MNDQQKQAIRAALTSGPKTTDELMEAAGLVGNLALFYDIVHEETDDRQMRRVPGSFPAIWEATDAR